MDNQGDDGYPADYSPQDDAPGELDQALEEWDHNAASEPDAPPALVEGIVPLGHDRGVFYYLSRAAGQVFELTPAQHSKASLMAMASIAHYWQRGEHFSPKGGILWDNAADDLMSRCRAIGIYDSSRVRGRGAWIDLGRAVLNLGDRLIVNGRSEGMALESSRHVYEAGTAMLSTLAPPLPTTEAHKLVTICQSLRWEAPINGMLLAGFIAVAPVCGGLGWRPSIWVVGASGSGKSWMKDNILAPALQGVALQVQSKTSEAGIRQTLGSDARPVLFDEAESEDEQAKLRMQGVLDLVRQSSSDGGADIVKGSGDGRAKRYRIRSCFAFSSINDSMVHEADKNRISVLGLRPPAAQPDEEAFARLNTLAQATVNADFAAGLASRSVKLLPIIRANAERFAVAVSIHLGNRRTGDQYGTLLAGAYSLHNERIISADDALDFVRKQDWNAVNDDQGEKDEYRLLSHLTAHRIRINGGNGGHWEPSIGSAILAAFGDDPAIPPDVADAELRQTGIKVDRDGRSITVSNSHPALRKILADTPWSANWQRSLARLSNAAKTKHPESFAFGHTARGVTIPMQTIARRGPRAA